MSLPLCACHACCRHQPSGLATIVITSVAEVPGLLLAMGMTWIWKGSTGFAGPFLLAAVSLIPRMAGACCSCCMRTYLGCLLAARHAH